MELFLESLTISKRESGEEMMGQFGLCRIQKKIFTDFYVIISYKGLMPDRGLESGRQSRFYSQPMNFTYYALQSVCEVYILVCTLF